MTSDELELLNNIANEYWEEFGQLVARHLMHAPQHLREELLTTLQERSWYTAALTSVTWRPVCEPAAIGDCSPRPSGHRLHRRVHRRAPGGDLREA
jgi:hypothetical protein